MIEVRELTKDYGATRAVNRLSFTARPGVVTAFLGPNGSGKSTTMRIILGLEVPTAGTALVNGQRCATIDWPMQTVGALLDAGAMHQECSAAEHLRCLAHSNGIGGRRVGEMLDEMGLSAVAGKRIGGLSLDMRQRLKIAGALLGDPGVLLLDDPEDGLDPEGIRWIRDLMRSLAAQGRTVLVSSSHISEMAPTADQLIIIGRGEMIAKTSTRELNERLDTSMRVLTECSRRDVYVRTPRRGGLTKVLISMGATVLAQADGGLSITGIAPWRIASAAAAHYIPILELTPRSVSFEDSCPELTSLHRETYTAPDDNGVPPCQPEPGSTDRFR